jgi:hypothetical protein
MKKNDISILVSDGDDDDDYEYDTNDDEEDDEKNVGYGEKRARRSLAVTKSQVEAIGRPMFV